MSAALRLELRHLELRVDPPLVNAGAAWDRRSMGCLSLHEVSAGAVVVSGLGEASPLPGYSPDGEVDVERALAAVAGPTLDALAAHTSVRELLLGIENRIGAQSPAARFGLETALLDRLARIARRPLWQLLAEQVGLPMPPDGIALCALAPSADPVQARQAVERHAASGVRTFKLKIGPERLRTEQEASLEVLRSHWGADITLRLDANGSLARSQLETSLTRLARFDPEFVEEPCASASAEQLADSPCPLALDESLQTLTLDERAEWITRARARAVVLKPTTLGGLGACLRLAEVARQIGCDAVVSHALEGPLGWSACAHLALALASPRAAGLWPLDHQRASLPAISGGCLLPSSAAGLGATS